MAVDVDELGFAGAVFQQPHQIAARQVFAHSHALEGLREFLLRLDHIERQPLAPHFVVDSSVDDKRHFQR